MTKPEECYRVCLTPEAECDLEGIGVYTARIWSVVQANSYIEELVETFDVLSNAPLIARERAEFTPPVRVDRHQSHVIIYRLSGKDLAVVRVAHMKQNWASLLGK
jgi:toxin ParE1/3/4